NRCSKHVRSTTSRARSLRAVRRRPARWQRALRKTMTWQIQVFGIRHLSPMGAWQLREFLERTKPDLVLIEGLDDATDLLPDVTRKPAQPPLAILAYTDTLPVRTLVYPLARYSP